MATTAQDIANIILGPLLKINEALLYRVLAEVLEANAEYIEDLNRAQLNAGIDADGREITPDYTNATVAIKNSKGQPTDRVTLHDTGAVYGAVFVDVFTQAFTIDNSDPKADDLRAKYGDAIFGLSTVSKAKLLVLYQTPIYRPTTGRYFMSINLMNASDARIFAESAENKRNTVNLDAVVSEIQKAIDLGKLRVMISIPILPYTRNFLEERGYKVEGSSSRNESFNDVSW